MNRIFNEIAHRYNSTPDEIEREINYALMQARKNFSPTAKAFWVGIDENASTEDIIRKIVSRVALVV